VCCNLRGGEGQKPHRSLSDRSYLRGSCQKGGLAGDTRESKREDHWVLGLSVYGPGDLGGPTKTNLGENSEHHRVGKNGLGTPF